MVLSPDPQISDQISDAEELEVENHRYHIDHATYEELGESLEFAIWNRLCWNGNCRVCSKYEDGFRPPLPVNIRSVNTLYNAVRICGRRDDFILANMTILEVVFRILLRNRNEPMHLLEIAEEIEKEWVSVLAMKSATPSIIQRLLEGNNQYHIARYVEAAE